MLAFRNMKRQLSNYLIYFVTIAITISLIFAMNNMIYNEDLQQRAATFSSLATGLLALSAFLAMIIAIVLGYANAYILRLRKREFGTYLTLGMKRHQIVKLFLVENSLLGIFATATGFLFGSLMYQGLMLFMSTLLAYPFTFSFVSLKGVMVTLVMIALIFAMTFVTSSFYLKRVTIYELIHGEQKAQKTPQRPLFSVMLTVVGAGAIVYAFVNFSANVQGVFRQQAHSELTLLAMLVLLAVAIIIFHIGLARSLMFLLLKSKWLRQRKTNQFIFRQLSASLNANALLLGLLAFLITFAIIATNTGFLYKGVEETNIDKRYPFDIMGSMQVKDTPAISPKEVEAEIEKYTTITEHFRTPLYTSGHDAFLKRTTWFGKGLAQHDVYVRESDMNTLLKSTGQQPIALKNQYAIYSDSQFVQNNEFTTQTINKKTYTLSHVEATLPLSVEAYFVIVVPDDVVNGMQHIETSYAWNVADEDFDARALNEALTYEQQVGNYTMQQTDYGIKQYDLLNRMAYSAIFIVGALYLGFVFVLLALAILALKTLSAIHDDQKRYRILARIGVSKSLQTTTLAKQLLLFFAFPVFVPILLTIPTALIAEQFVQLLGFNQELTMYALSAMIVAVMLVIYGIYFFVTFAITKKNVL